MRPDPQQEYVDYLTARLPYLRRTAYLLCGGDVHRAEDVVQGTAVTLYLKWQRAGAADNIDAYVHRMLVRQHIRTHRLAWSRVLLVDRAAERAAPDAASVEERDRVARALARLGQGQRTVIVLRYFCDLSVVDTAAALGCTEGTVKSQTARGLATLRGLLSEPVHVSGTRGSEHA
jgi:RNA polymerase sigma-70 factor (sigma-E family)